MGTTEWGPSAWKFLHTMTFAYGSEDGSVSAAERIAARSLFESLKHLLPCKACCSHYCSALTERPLTDQVLSSRENLSRWFVDIHNDVNVRLHKPVMAYEDAAAMYTQFVGCDAKTAASSECAVQQQLPPTANVPESQLHTTTSPAANGVVAGSIGGVIGFVLGVLGVVLFVYIRGLKRVKVVV